MAHTCPECGSYCTCCGDWEDADRGVWYGCVCCIDNDELDDDMDFIDDDDFDDDDPNDSRNLKKQSCSHC